MATDKKDADAGQAEVQKKVEQAEDRGYLGTKVDPRPNSDYSLESGPDSPGVLDAKRVDVADLGKDDR